MTTYQPPPEERPMHPNSGQVSAALIAALLRDIAIVVAVIIYAIDVL